ncbi:MAG: hypothetical protein ACRDJY_11990 [Thermoleophilaceae bacterium]
MDWLSASEFVRARDVTERSDLRAAREQAGSALQVVADGVRYEGYDAVRVVLEACPPTFLAAPLLRLPPLRLLGTRVFAKIAVTRTVAVQPA